MIVTCPLCSSRFQYDESRFKGAPSKRFQCTACSAIFDVDSPFGRDFEAERSPGAAPANQDGNGESGGRVTQNIFAYLGEEQKPATPISEDDTGATFFGGAGPFGANFKKRQRASLVFLTGPKSSSAIELAKSRTVIGRDEGDVTTMDPETSKRHAMIEIMNDGTVWVTDLGSTNGTIIDGVQIASTAQLRDRQEFTCGNSTFMIMIDKD